MLILFLPVLISAQEIFISGDIEVCTNASEDAQVKVSFLNSISPYSFVYAIDGLNQETIITSENPYYIQTKTEGIYTITYFADAVSGGIIDGSAQVTVLESPIARFSTDSDTISILNKSLNMQDVSDGNIVAWEWDFGDGNISSSQHPYHSYEDSDLGVYQIKLIVTDDMGCSDTITKEIWIFDHHWMYIPNSFTPNYDNINDRFCIEYNAIREETFIFKVFNSLGDVVYMSTSPNELRCSNDGGWDGIHALTGEVLPGKEYIADKTTYIYELYYQDFQGWKRTKYGNIRLRR